MSAKQSVAVQDCRYCHNNHHISNCPKLAAKKRYQEQEQQNKQVSAELATVAAKPSSWVSIAAKGRSEAVVQKIKKEEEEQKKRNEEKAKRDAEIRKQIEQEEKENRERRHIYKMIKMFGLTKYQAMGYEPLQVIEGDFWYFRIENTKKMDFEGAKQLREDPSNKTRYEAYLREKYFKDWLNESYCSEDDCPYLQRLREIEEQAQYDAEQAQEERTKRYIEEQQKERTEMAQKLKSGEITRQEYIEWKYECEMDDDYAMESSSFDWYSHSLKNSRERFEWQERKTAREEAVKAAMDADELKKRIV